MEEINIGKFRIQKGANWISITINEKGNAAGEGGHFEEDKLEKFIALFYELNF